MRKWKEFVGSTISSGFTVKEVMGTDNVWRGDEVKSLFFHFVFKVTVMTECLHIDGNDPVEREIGVRERGQHRDQRL